jgi:site-specific recombinase XerD
MSRKISYETYLVQMGHTPSGVKSYLCSGNIIARDLPNITALKYKDIVDYLFSKSERLKNVNHKNFILYGLKKYYDYLIEIGKCENHPCKTLKIKTKQSKEVIHQDLFSTKELQLLNNKEERYSILKVRNEVMLSLLLNQALVLSELKNIKLKSVDLDEGSIYIKASKTLNRRKLYLSNQQLDLFIDYIKNHRQKLIKTKCDYFLVGKLGTQIGHSDANYLVKYFGAIFPDRHLCPLNIRRSVIANWLNEKQLSLEQVQYMSGHKLTSTTLRYRQKNIEEQLEQINKWFPFKQSGFE